MSNIVFKSNSVKFTFEAAGNPTMREKIIQFPDPSLLDLEVGTVIEVNFESDCYYADFKVADKQVNKSITDEGLTEATEYVYNLKYIPRTTKTRTEYEKAKDKAAVEEAKRTTFLP